MGILNEETAEETAAIQSDLEGARDQPFDVNSLLTDVDQAHAEEAVPEKPAAKSGTTAAKPVEAKTAAPEIEERQTGQEEPAWIKSLPETEQDEARKHLKGIRGELSRRRDAERKAREKAEHEMVVLRQKIDDYIARHQAQAEPPPPDPEVDPLGYAKHKEAEAEKHRLRADESERRTAEERQYTEQVNAVFAYAQEVEQEFREEVPDYDDAVKFGRDAYVRAMEAAGYTAKAADAELKAGLFRQAAQMQQMGGNFAKWVYAKAKELGYKGGSAAQPEPAKAARTAAQSIAKGQQASKSLGKNGKPVSSDLTWDSLSGMEGEDFDRAFEALIEKETGKSRRLF